MARRKRTTAQDRADARRRKKELKADEKAIEYKLRQLIDDKATRIDAIPDDAWDDAEANEPLNESVPGVVYDESIAILGEARDWRAAVNNLSDVGRLVHLAGRMDGVDEEQIRTELLRIRRTSYESELSIQAGRVGCPGRSGMLTAGPSLSALNEMSVRDAGSMVNTYNYTLATRIQAVRDETPTANRHVYAYRISGFMNAKVTDKSSVSAGYADSTARSMAQQDFYSFNSASMGTAQLEPRAAVCPICRGWSNRGEVLMPVALNNPPPYHPRCPHFWRTNPQKVARDECPNLWMG